MVAPVFVAATLLLFVSVAVAAVDPPTITTPAAGAVVGARPATVAGTAPGQYVAIRVMEGATQLAETGTVNGSWSVAIDFPDGSHTIHAIGRDGQNNLGPASPSVTFTIDTVAPATPVIAAPANGSVITFSTFAVEGVAEPGARVELDINTASPVSTTADGGGVWRISRTWSDTTHTVRARAFDRAGNPSLQTSPVSFIVDTTPPVPPRIDTPLPGTFTNQASVAIAGRSELGAQILLFESSQIGSTVAGNAGGWNKTLTFAPGTHVVYARARDAAGNLSASSATVSFTVDTSAPPAPAIATPGEGALVSPSGAVITGTAEPFSTVQLLQGNNVVTTETVAGPDGRWSIDFPYKIGSTYSVYARARDRAGNTGPVSPTRTFTIDASPPIVTFKTSSGTIFTPLHPVLVEGDVHDDHAASRVILDFYDVTGHGIASWRATCYGCGTTDAKWTLTHSPLVGRFIVRAYSYDTVGNKSEFAEISVIIVRVN